MKLNGWHRLGIVFSVVWVVVVSSVGAASWSDPEKHRTFAEKGWTKVPQTPADVVKRETEADPLRRPKFADFGPWQQAGYVFSPRRFLLWLLMPVVGAWAFAYVLLFAARWVAAGFRR